MWLTFYSGGELWEGDCVWVWDGDHQLLLYHRDSGDFVVVLFLAVAEDLLEYSLGHKMGKKAEKRIAKLCGNNVMQFRIL